MSWVGFINITRKNISKTFISVTGPTRTRHYRPSVVISACTPASFLAITNEHNHRPYYDRCTRRQTALISGIAPLRPGYHAAARLGFAESTVLHFPQLHTLSPSQLDRPGSTPSRTPRRTSARQKASFHPPILDESQHPPLPLIPVVPEPPYQSYDAPTRPTQIPKQLTEESRSHPQAAPASAPHSGSLEVHSATTQLRNILPRSTRDWECAQDDPLCAVARSCLTLDCLDSIPANLGDHLQTHARPDFQDVPDPAFKDRLV